MILLIGSQGSMGKRYQAIFNYLNLKYIACDKESNQERISELAIDCEKILIATPTKTHKEIIKYLIPLEKDILCEKPICLSSKDVEEIINLKPKLNMVFQYGELVHNTVGNSYYDYFRTGNDGLIWDCLQIIALAHDKVNINNKSPIWKCMINGLELNIRDMDMAYVNFIKSWSENKINQSHKWIIDVHKKVENYV